MNRLNKRGNMGDKTDVLHTWENLAEEVNFLLEVSMRELLMCWLHKVLAGVEEILKNRA